MTDVSFSDVPRLRRTRAQPETIALPKPQPFGAPVLIGDCVTPLGGDTLLGLLMKKMMQSNEDG